MNRKLQVLAIPAVLVLALAVAAVAFAAPTAAHCQGTGPFYSVDTERTIEGAVKDIVLEPRYGGRAPFLILLVEEKGTGTSYRIEISPAWFFGRDLHKGEKVKVIGSYYAAKDGTKIIIARQLQAGGETFMLRDSRGFPTWRGGSSKAKGWKGRGPGR